MTARSRCRRISRRPTAIAATRCNASNGSLTRRRLIAARIELQPDFSQACNNLGTCLRELKRPDEAEAAYRRALRLDADNAETLDNLALALKDLERWRGSRGCCCVARSRSSPAATSCCVHYGSILLDQEQDRGDGGRRRARDRAQSQQSRCRQPDGPRRFRARRSAGGHCLLPARTSSQARSGRRP